MVFKVVFSTRAETDLENTIIYLNNNWSEKIAKEYADKVDRVIEIISKMPFLYPKIDERKNIRKCLIVKQNAMYYKVKKQTVTILSIFDTRQNPKKLKL